MTRVTWCGCKDCKYNTGKNCGKASVMIEKKGVCIDYELKEKQRGIV